MKQLHLFYLFYIYIYIYKNIKIIGSTLGNVTMNLNEHKLANVDKGIMNKKRLKDFGLREIKEKFIVDVKDIDSGNLDISGCGYY